MTQPFDPKLEVWRILVQFGDVVSFIDDEHDGKRLVGTVYGACTSWTTAGTMATYRIGDEEDREFDITNGHDPRVVDSELLAEYRARQKVVVARKNVEFAEKLKGYYYTSRAVGYGCKCDEKRGYIAPHLTLIERCIAAMPYNDPKDETDLSKFDKWSLITEVAKLAKERDAQTQRLAEVTERLAKAQTFRITIE